MTEGTKDVISESINTEEALRLLKLAGIDESVLQSLERKKEILSAEEINPEISEILTKEHQKIIDCLVENALSKRASRDCDQIIDDEVNRQDVVYATPEDKFEGRIKNVLEKVLENLKRYFPITGIGIVYKDPLTKAPREINTDGVSEGKVAQVTKDYKPEHQFHPYGIDEFHHIKEMTIGPGTGQLGHIDFIFSDTKMSRFIIESTDAVKSVIDTFLDTRLKKFLKQTIEEKKREIIERNNTEGTFKWRNICMELLQMLGDMGLDGLLLCKRFEFHNPEITQIDTKGNITETAETLDCNIQTKVRQLEFEFNGIQELTYQNPQESLGTLLFKYNTTTDEEIARFVCDCLSDVLRQREDIRYAYVKSVGPRYADAIVDDNVEQQGQHEIVTLFGDINGYSEFTNKIEEYVKRGIYKTDPLPEIMEIYSKEINKIIAFFGVLDKLIGDALIAHLRLPFDKNGRDVLGHKDGEHDISHFIKIALTIPAIVQSTFEKVLNDIEKKYGIKLPKHPVFSWAIKAYEGVVGIYGDLKSRETQINVTVFGPKMNETARLQSGAKKGAILVDQGTWEKYKAAGNEEFVEQGPPIEWFGKNIKGLLRAVTVIPKQEFLKMEAEQNIFFEKKKEQRKTYNLENPDTPIPYYYCNEETMDLLPEGDYIITMHNDDKEGPIILEVASLDKKNRFKIKLKRDRVIKQTFSVGKKTLDEFNEERKKYDFSREKTLRVMNNNFLFIRYLDIEETIKEKIEEVIAKNREAQQECFTLEQLPPWRYKIIKKDDETDGDIKFELSGCGNIFKLLIKSHEKNAIMGIVTDAGYVEHREGCLYF